ncbi:acyltransferase family protein [Streptomyces sp. NPDC051366]|uniref:acyltransferase family protein n=1 Tax=Streptomyces sp. NPDC051366 TaxID=3365652 RepID=UPI0037B1E466
MSMNGTVGSRPVRPPRLPSLTGLRFPAALLVFFFHASLGVPWIRLFEDDAANDAFAKYASQAGALGVTFFFVLSGFVLTWSARDRDTMRAFWRRRFVKIYPNYVITWALALLTFAAVMTKPWQAVVNLLMVQVWVPDFATNFSVDPPSWSLGAEAIFYLAFPLLFLLIKKIDPARLKWWIAGVVAAICLTPTLTYAVIPGGGMQMPGADGTSTVQYWFAYVLPPVRLLDFALGILVARAVMAGRWRNIGTTWSALLLAVSYAVAMNVEHLYAQRSVTLVPIVLLIAAVATRDAENKPTPFNNRFMIWLGEISFAFYLLHYIVLAYSRELLGDQLYSTPVAVALIAAQTVVAVLLSWALYAWVEAPITRRFSSSRKVRAAKAAAAEAAVQGSGPSDSEGRTLETV